MKSSLFVAALSLLWFRIEAKKSLTLLWSNFNGGRSFHLWYSLTNSSFFFGNVLSPFCLYGLMIAVCSFRLNWLIDFPIATNAFDPPVVCKYFLPFVFFLFQLIFFNFILFRHIQDMLSKMICTALPHYPSGHVSTFFLIDNWFVILLLFLDSLSCLLQIFMLNKSIKYKKCGSNVEV